MKDKDGKTKPLYLKRATDTHIRHHNKIKAEATPFDPRFKEYFKQRTMDRNASVYASKTAKSTGLIIQPYAGLSGMR